MALLGGAFGAGSSADHLAARGARPGRSGLSVWQLITGEYGGTVGSVGGRDVFTALIPGGPSSAVLVDRDGHRQRLPVRHNLLIAFGNRPPASYSYVVNQRTVKFSVRR